MELVHVTLSAEVRRTLGVTEDALRIGARRITSMFGGRLVLYCVADDHVHVVLIGSRADVARRVGDTHQSLQFALLEPLQAAHFTPVSGRKHLERLVSYVLGQPTHHGLRAHPAEWAGSCAWDLLGARHIDGFDAGLIRKLLPRWSDADFVRAVQLERLSRVEDVVLEGRELRSLRYAAARSAAVSNDMRGRASNVPAARLVYADLARRAGFSSAVVRDSLGLGRRWAFQAMASRVPPESSKRALAQLALMDAIGALRAGPARLTTGP